MFTYFRYLATLMQSNESSSEMGLKLSKWGSYLLSFLLLLVAFTEFFSEAPKSGNFSMDLRSSIALYAFSLDTTPIPKTRGNALESLFWPFVFLVHRLRLFNGCCRNVCLYRAAERGERLGVPGFQGTLIFLALMQIPSILFRKKP